MRESQGKIITFYSYKGGTGRSMALANVAWILASNGKKVLAVDWDLEAPGLHRYFYPFLLDKDLTSTDGLIDFVIDFAVEAATPEKENEIKSDWYKSYANVLRYAASLDWKFPGEGTLDFISAGRQVATYSTKVNSFNWQNFYDRLGGGVFLEAAKEKMRAEYDYILIDSRTGVSDTSGICTVQLPDILVVCFTLNYQSINGAATVASSVWEQRKDSEIVILPVPMRIENAEKAKLEERREYARRSFALFPRYNLSDANKSYWVSLGKNEFWKNIEVSYVPYYAYEELLAAFGDKPDQPHTMLAASEELTTHLTSGEVKRLTPPPESLRRVVVEAYAGTVRVLSDAANLSKSAENLIRAMLPEEQAVAQQVLTRLVRLAGPGEVSEDSRLKVKLGDLDKSSRVMVDSLVSAGVIAKALDGSNGEETIELADDSLISNWERMKDWISKDREFLFWLQRLRTAKAEWSSGRGAKSRLLSASFLVESKRWLHEREADLKEDEREYIGASVRYRAITRAAVVAVVTAVLAIPIVLGTLSVRGRENAQRAAELSARAAEVRSQQPDLLQLSALLAIESLNQSATDQGEQVLREDLTLLPTPVMSLGFKGGISAVAFDSSNSFLAIGVKSGGSTVWDLRDVLNMRPRQILPLNQDENKNNGAVNAISFSEDGRYIATAGADCTAKVWDVANIKLIASLAHDDRVTTVVFSKDSRYIATGSWDGVARVWDVQSGMKVSRMFHNGYVKAVAFSSNGKYLATASGDGTARIWLAADGRQVFFMHDDDVEGGVNSVAFSPDDHYLATGSFDMTARVWDVSSGLQVLKIQHGGSVNSVVFSRDGKYLATASFDKSAKVIDTATGKQVARMQHTDKVYYVAFSRNADYLATASEDHTARVWETTSGNEISRMIHNGSVLAIAFSPDDAYLATGSTDKSARVWRTKHSEETRRLIEHGDAKDLIQRACDCLTRNLTEAEWKQLIPTGIEYRKTCPDLPL